MSFDEYFEKSFTFSIEPKDKPMSIKVVGQNEFPFIDTYVFEQTVYVKIDGPSAREFTNSEDFAKVAFNINVNQEIFTFNIEMG